MGDINRDQSMEEILASIKRVIAEEEEAAPPAPRAPRTRSKAAAEDEDVLELNGPLAEEDSLLSTGAAESSRHKLAALAALRQQSDPAPASDAPLEALVREMLKPILKEWLDQRLPEIVEELVAREIARIAGKPL
jgi:cell pole-organizing protein PopZ